VNRWALTAESKDLFDALYRGAISGKRARVAALHRIGELGHPAAVPRLAGFLDPSKRHEAAAALQAIGHLLQSAKPAELRRLDLEIRRQAPYWGFGKLRAKDVARLRSLSGESLAAAAICSMHRSGYVREAAVRELAVRRDTLELPYLILRAADWVPGVRRLAQDAVMARLTAPYLHALVSCLTLVEGESFATGRASSLAPAVDALLGDPESADALLAGLSVPDRPSRRAVARRLAGLQTVPPATFSTQQFARTMSWSSPSRRSLQFKRLKTTTSRAYCNDFGVTQSAGSASSPCGRQHRDSRRRLKRHFTKRYSTGREASGTSLSGSSLRAVWTLRECTAMPFRDDRASPSLSSVWLKWARRPTHHSLLPT
jgi:hypothetical protein